MPRRPTWPLEAGPQACERRDGVDQISDAPGLVGGQGIHRVDDNRPDPLALVAALAWLVSGERPVGLSALYGAAVAVVPAALRLTRAPGLAVRLAA